MKEERRKYIIIIIININFSNITDLLNHKCNEQQGLIIIIIIIVTTHTLSKVFQC